MICRLACRQEIRTRMITTPLVSVPQQQINLIDAGDQQDPAVLWITISRYLVVWTEAAGGPIGSSPGSDLVGKVFDAAGNRVGMRRR